MDVPLGGDMVEPSLASGSGVALRRLAVTISPALSAVLIVAATFLDPAIDASGREMAAAYAAHPQREQVSALALHFAFAFLAIPTVALIVAVRGRGVGLANLAAVFAVLGLTTLPGFLVTDFYDIAIYGELGGDAWTAVNSRLEALPGATVLFLSGFLGFTLALPTALLGAWRAGALPWWPAAAAFIGFVGGNLAPGAYGLFLLAASLVAISWALSRWTQADLAKPATRSGAARSRAV